MNRDQIRGASRHLKGRAQTTLGGIAGDPGRQVRGAYNQVAGGAQYTYGRARDRVEDITEQGQQRLREARRHGDAYGRRALRYAEDHRGRTLASVAALAFAAGWLASRIR